MPPDDDDKDPKNDPAAGGDPAGDGGDDDKKPRTFTQEEVNRIMAREKNDGRRTATADLLNKLGVKTVEEAEAVLAKHREADEANLSEAEKARKAAEDAKAAADKAKDEAARDRLAARVERALIKAGVEDKDLARVARLVDIEDLDADQDAVNAEVEKLKEDMPQLFETVEGKKTDPKPGGGDPGRPPRNGGKPTPQDEAKAILAKRHPKTVKSST